MKNEASKKQLSSLERQEEALAKGRAKGREYWDGAREARTRGNASKKQLDSIKRHEEGSAKGGENTCVEQLEKNFRDGETLHLISCKTCRRLWASRMA